MTTKSSYGSSWTNVTGTWTDTALAYDGNTTTYAYITVAASGTGAGAVGGYGFGSGGAHEIPADVTLQDGNVVADVWFDVSIADRWVSVTLRAYDGSTALGTAVDLTSYLSTSDSNHAQVALNGLTTANLRSSNFNVRITGLRNGASSNTFYLRQITLDVTYSYSVKQMWTGSTWKPFVVWTGNAWSSDYQVWTGTAWV